ncbi:MAG: thiamine-phosphate kinase [Ammonifex sp.]|nr:MAG: thiamine-phosphate kinase [Ammonifex sp.]
MKIHEIGEFGLIARLTSEIETGAGVVKGIGDDAAVLDNGERLLLFTTDAVVEGVHFDLQHVAVEDVGYKSLAVNISDIAAMGGKPTYAVISVGLPDYFTVADADALYRGLREVARNYGVAVVGGDTTGAPVLIVSVALLGEASPAGVRYRSSALPGDIVCVTGSLGGSAGGLFLQENGGFPCPEPLRDLLLRKHRRPEPRVAAGRMLGTLSGVHALIDISDGLASDASHIARASGVRCHIYKAAVPVEPATELVARRAGKDPVDWGLYGGEDYELLFTVAPAAMGEVSAALSECGADCRPVGKVLEGKGLWMVLTDGSLTELSRRGYEHFAAAGGNR